MTPLRRRAGRLAAAAAALAAALPLVILATASPASAAASCTTTSEVSVGDTRWIMPTTSGHSIDCVLGSGNQSSAVRNLQQHLNACYWSGSSIPRHRSTFGTALVTDGIYGARTSSALASAQRSHGIAADGVYGPQTRRTLLFHNFFGYCSALGV